MRYLAGDVGGTKTLLALYEGELGALEEVRSARLASAEHASLEAAVREFLGDEDADIEDIEDESEEF